MIHLYVIGWAVTTLAATVHSVRDFATEKKRRPRELAAGAVVSVVLLAVFSVMWPLLVGAGVLLAVARLTPGSEYYRKPLSSLLPSRQR